MRAPTGAARGCYASMPVAPARAGEALDAAMTRPPHQPPAPGLRLGQKTGIVFAVLAVALAILTAQDVRQLQHVRLDAEKFLEETREAQAAQRLQSTIEQLHLLARHPDDGAFAGERAALLDRMGQHLAVLAAGRPGADDPSRDEHESTEQGLVTELRGGLEILRGDAVDGHSAMAVDLLWQLQETADEVREETAEEAALASRDLDDRVAGLIRVVSLTAVFSIAVLLILLRLVHLHVLRPVQLLQRGAELFGAGRLDHRIRVDSSDEIGDLADEFNRMADRLTETHRDLEERVRARTEEFIRAARLADLGTFAAGVAHEVNTPLASIASCAEGLERRLRAGTASPDEEMEYLKTIAHEAYRARDITQRLLAFARQERGPVSDVDLRQAVGNVTRLIEHDLRRRSLKLEVDCGEDLPLLEGHAAELEQVLLNLLLNARDAAPDGTTIRLRCREEQGGLVLEVEDQGPGVAPELAGRIFDPFFTTKPPGEGTGLGLSLVYRIVEGHGGSVEADRAPGGGALFRVRLPATANESVEAP